MKPWKRMLMESDSGYSSDAIWVQIIRTTESGGICRLGNVVTFHTGEGYDLHDLALYSNAEIDETENTVGVVVKKFDGDVDSIDDSEIEDLIADGLEERKERKESKTTYKYDNYGDKSYSYGRGWDMDAYWDSGTHKKEKEIKFYGSKDREIMPFIKYLKMLKTEGYKNDIEKIQRQLDKFFYKDTDPNMYSITPIDDIESDIYYYFQTPVSAIMMGWLYENKKDAGDNSKTYIFDHKDDFIKISGNGKADMIISDSFNESTDKYFKNEIPKEKEETETEPAKKLYNMGEKARVRNDITPGTKMETITGFKDSTGKPTVTTIMFTSEHKEHAGETISIDGYSITGLYISASVPELLWAHSFLIPINSRDKLQYQVSDIKDRLFTIIEDAMESEPAYMAWGTVQKNDNIILSNHKTKHPKLWKGIKKVYSLHNPTYRNVYGFNSYKFETEDKYYYIDVELYSGDDIESILGGNPLSMGEIIEATEKINKPAIEVQEIKTNMEFIESRTIDVKKYGYNKYDFVSGRLNLYESRNNT